MSPIHFISFDLEGSKIRVPRPGPLQRIESNEIRWRARQVFDTLARRFARAVMPGSAGLTAAR